MTTPNKIKSVHHEMNLKQFFHTVLDDLIQKIPEKIRASNYDKEKFPTIIVGKRQLMFDKEDTVSVYYGLESRVHMDGIFKLSETKAAIRYLEDENSPPPSLVAGVLEIVSMLMKEGLDVLIFWNDCGHPEIHNGKNSLKFGLYGPGTMNFYFGEQEFGLVDTDRAIKFFLDDTKGGA